LILKQSHLAYFVKVAETGQITHAARILHVAQPALSQAIAQLEAQLGVKLLERHPRGVSLTPAGEIFLEKARIALDAQADAAATAASLARDLRGAMQIGFLSIPPMLMAPNLLEAFGRANPRSRSPRESSAFPPGRPRAGSQMSMSRSVTRPSPTATWGSFPCGPTFARSCCVPITLWRTARRFWSRM
jgi:molybdenum-dependent DNA-binding transcriptional regulator ModE